MRVPVPVLVLCLCLASAAAAQAQTQASAPRPRPTPDFLFERPDRSIGVRGSWIFAGAGSDWYNFVTRHLTLEDKDFNAPAIGVDVGFAISPRVDVVAGFEFAQTTSASEYRDFVDNLRLPIEQQTRLRQMNLSGSLKFALTERGRAVGSFAWVPRRLVPYVGAGGGMLWFEVNQQGDFVDAVDSSIFTDVLESQGWTPSAHLFGGVDVRMFRRLYLTLDARYVWASGDLGREWVGFDPIDLTGIRVAAGINLVF